MSPGKGISGPIFGRTDFSPFFLSGRRIFSRIFFRKAPDTFNFLGHVMRAIWSVRSKCSHRCVSLTETSLKPVQPSSTQPKTQPSKLLLERNGLNILRFKLFRCISYFSPDFFSSFLWENGFFTDFYFRAAGFFRGFSRRMFSPYFCGEKVPTKILQENPRQNPPKIIQQKSPTHFF